VAYLQVGLMIDHQRGKCGRLPEHVDGTILAGVLCNTADEILPGLSCCLWKELGGTAFKGTPAADPPSGFVPVTTTEGSSRVLSSSSRILSMLCGYLSSLSLAKGVRMQTISIREWIEAIDSRGFTEI